MGCNAKFKNLVLDYFWACWKVSKMICHNLIAKKLTKKIGSLEMGFCQTRAMMLGQSPNPRIQLWSCTNCENLAKIHIFSQKLLNLCPQTHICIPICVFKIGFYKNGPFPASFSLFSYFQFTVDSRQMLIINFFCQWLDSNLGPLVLEETVLPTEPPNHCHWQDFFTTFSLHFMFICSIYSLIHLTTITAHYKWRFKWLLFGQRLGKLGLFLFWVPSHHTS